MFRIPYDIRNSIVKFNSESNTVCVVLSWKMLEFVSCIFSNRFWNSGCLLGIKQTVHESTGIVYCVYHFFSCRHSVLPSNPSHASLLQSAEMSMG